MMRRQRVRVKQCHIETIMQQNLIVISHKLAPRPILVAACRRLQRYFVSNNVILLKPTLYIYITLN